jgi:hypothetical protein
MEMLMLSGLKAQSEINRLLDEIYGGPSRASLSETKRCSKTPDTNRHPEGSRTNQLSPVGRNGQAAVGA